MTTAIAQHTARFITDNTQSCPPCVAAGLFIGGLLIEGCSSDPESAPTDTAGHTADATTSSMTDSTIQPFEVAEPPKPFTGEDVEDTTDTPQPQITADHFVLAEQSVLIGLAPCGVTDWVPNITPDPEGAALGVCTDITGDAHSSVSTLWSIKHTEGEWLIEKDMEQSGVLDEVIVNPNDPTQVIAIAVGGNAATPWGWKTYDRSANYFVNNHTFGAWTLEDQAGPAESYEADFLKGLAISSDHTLAVGASNILVDAPSGVVKFVSDNNTHFVGSGGENLTSITFATVQSREILLGVNSGKFPYEKGGSLVLIDPHWTNESPVEALYRQEPIPAGLGITGKLSTAETELGLTLALPSAKNDGRIYFAHFNNLGDIERSADGTLPYVTLPGISAEEGGLHFITHANFSPCGGRFVATSNFNTQHTHVFDRSSPDRTNPDGTFTHNIALNDAPSSAAVWSKYGLIYMDGLHVMILPYKEGHLATMKCAQ